MKKFFSSFFLTLFFTLTSASPVLATWYTDPKPSSSGTGFFDDINSPNTNSTSVTLMIEGNAGNAALVPNACYILGKSFVWNPVTRNGQQFYKQGSADEAGWTANDFGRQAGGNLCGFLKNPIQGSGSDNPADYVRADSDGRLWYYKMCENFEGVRTDCNQKFALNKEFEHTLFRVLCGYYDPNDDHNGDEEPDNFMPGSNPLFPRSNFQQLADPLCDISKANLNSKGTPELQIFELKDVKQTQGKDISEKELWTGAFQDVGESSFVIFPDFGSNRFNPNSNTVKTEFGDIPRDPAELATVVLRIAIGVAGGVAFLLMVYGSFRLIFARGDPEQVQQGREIITAAIIGLLVVIFSTFILQLVGISIFGFDI